MNVEIGIADSAIKPLDTIAERSNDAVDTLNVAVTIAVSIDLTRDNSMIGTAHLIFEYGQDRAIRELQKHCWRVCQ